MNENTAGGSQAVPPPPSDDRRNRASHDVEEQPDVVFVERKISQQKLDSLKEFLKTATADDIATIRKMYGESLEVLRLIGLEIHEP